MLQPWFSEAKLGIFIHWGIYAVKPTGESWPFFLGEISHADYLAQRHGFTASRYDPAAWASLFARAGARYAVLTTKHHDGFALWDTKVSTLSSVQASPAGRDLITPYTEALRREGLKVGLYYSHLDWTHPDYATLPPPQVPADGKPVNPFTFRGVEDPVAWRRFLTFHRAQLRELCSEQAPDLLWFDGDWERRAEEFDMKGLREELHRWAPGVVLNARMGGHPGAGGYGDYATPEQGVPVSPPALPWELCLTLNDHWGFFESDHNYKSVPQLIWYLLRCVAGGGNLLLDIGPRADGTIPQEQVERLEGLGDWIRPRAEAIYGTRAGLPAGCCEHLTALSADGRTVFLYHFGIPGGPIPLVGLRSKVARVRLVDNRLAGPAEAEHRSVGGAAWAGIPGVRWILPGDLPFDPVCTVFAIDLETPLELVLGEGKVITNGA
jgi:alpha-L-fucosidase